MVIYKCNFNQFNLCEQLHSGRIEGRKIHRDREKKMIECDKNQANRLNSKISKINRREKRN